MSIAEWAARWRTCRSYSERLALYRERDPAATLHPKASDPVEDRAHAYFCEQRRCADCSRSVSGSARRTRCPPCQLAHRRRR